MYAINKQYENMYTIKGEIHLYTNVNILLSLIDITE